MIEVKSGLTAGDVVVARAGSFLRNGDAVRAIFEDASPSVRQHCAWNWSDAENPGTAGKIE